MGWRRGRGPVRITREAVHDDDTGPLSWTEQVRPGRTVHDLLVEVAGRLPRLDGSRCWVAYVRSPGDRWSWTRSAEAVLRDGDVVMTHPGATVASVFAACNWQATLHLALHAADEPDAGLLAHVEHSPDRYRT